MFPATVPVFKFSHDPSTSVGMTNEEENWIRRRGRQGEERFLSAQVDTSQEQSGKQRRPFCPGEASGTPRPWSG